MFVTAFLLHFYSGISKIYQPILLMEAIRKAGAIIIKDKKSLIVRPKGKAHFLTPGGKYEAGENAQDCLKRELMEELQVELISCTHYKDYYFEKAQGKEVPIYLDLYRVEIKGDPNASSEIEEMQWMSKEDFENETFNVADSFYTHVPDLIKDGLI